VEPTRALAAPHPGRPPGWLMSRALRRAGMGGGIPSTSPRATTRCPGGKHGKFGQRWGAMLPPGHRVVGRRQADGIATQSHHARSVIIWGRGWEEAPDRESDVWQPTDHQSAPATEDPPDLHQLVHQRLWTATHILGLNSKIRSDHGLIRTSWWVLHPTTDQMVNRHIPSADQYPRRGDGRKGA
jgi:hypothetical protein